MISANKAILAIGYIPPFIRSSASANSQIVYDRFP